MALDTRFPAGMTSFLIIWQSRNNLEKSFAHRFTIIGVYHNHLRSILFDGLVVTI
jgi:hypothetical protein